MSNPLEMVRQTISTHNMISPVGSEKVAEQTGSYKGEAVKATPENSKLTQASKAVKPAGLQKTNFQTLQTRSVRQGQGTHHNALARIADYHEKLPNFPEGDQIQSLVDSFQSLSEVMVHSQLAVVHREHRHAKEDKPEEKDPLELEESGTQQGEDQDSLKRGLMDQVFELLHRFDPDVTHQYAALELLRDHFQSIGAGEDFLKALDEAKASFETGDVAREVRAGFASAAAAARAAATLESDPGLVRDAYRMMLRAEPNLGALFDQLAKFDLKKNFDQIIGTFLEAAGSDLRSTSPSTDDRFLHGLVTELGKLKKMRTVLEAARQVIRLTERLMPLAERGKMTDVDLTSRLLHFAAKAVTSVSDARSVLGPVDTLSASSKVVFLNAVKGLHGEIPDEVMPSPQARIQQGSSLVLLLDQLVAQEEDDYERRQG